MAVFSCSFSVYIYYSIAGDSFTDHESPEESALLPMEIEWEAEFSASHVQSIIPDDSTKRGYALVLDNINQRTHTRHSTVTKQNKQLNMVQGYAFQDRINTLHLSDNFPEPSAILSLPIQSYLPTSEELDIVKSEMGTMLLRLLIKYLPHLHHHQKEACKPIPHEYIEEASKKTPTVSNIIIYANSVSIAFSEKV